MSEVSEALERCKTLEAIVLDKLTEKMFALEPVRDFLPENPTLADLFRFRNRKLKRKRLRKKFFKNPDKYVCYEIMHEFLLKQCMSPPGSIMKVMAELSHLCEGTADPLASAGMVLASALKRTLD